jgi:isocitrate dehydrogenase
MSSEIEFDKLEIPKEGERIQIEEDHLVIPNKVIIPFIEGDGTGVDIMPVARKVLETAIKQAYKGKRKIIWLEIYAGEKAQEVYGELLPQDTIKAIQYFTIALKGPLTTPVGGGHRSLNVSLRQILDLSCSSA